MKADMSRYQIVKERGKWHVFLKRMAAPRGPFDSWRAAWDYCYSIAYRNVEK